MGFIKTVKKYIPRNIKKAGLRIYDSFLISRSKAKHKKVLAEVRKKEKIKVAFFLIHSSIWKYDGVYRLMEMDDRFDPIVVVCPYIIFGRETMLTEMNKAIEFCKRKGYKTISTYNEADDKWLDVKNEVQPDIVFFTNPWKLTSDQYYIHEYTDTLTCYVPYFFHVTKHLEENYDGILQNLTWKSFYETQRHFEFAKQYARNKASNVVITGYPAFDPFFEKNQSVDDVWKIKSKKIKRIIWAPHHTIEGQDAGLSYSNFEKYANFFLNLAKDNCESLQIAFKPHPILKSKLYRDESWGIEKTDAYFNEWNSLENGMFVDGDYTNLFLTSDALIHDCASFTVEYLTTKKPSLYTFHDSDVPKRLNDFGRAALAEHYQAFDEQGVLTFIREVVINEIDDMRNRRIKFVESFLLPPTNQTASQNIYNELIKELC